MLRKLLAFTLLVVPAPFSRAQNPPNTSAQPQPKEDTCVVSGMVVRRDDAAPLKGATVHLQLGEGAREDREHTIATNTGVDGRFELHNIPPGQYKLTVTRNGYADYEYGQKKASDPGATFTLRPGQRMSDLLFKLWRAAVISGRIYDEDGEPMAGVFVTPMRQIYHDGRKQLQMLDAERSNDLGEYRIFGLKPGRYFVSAQPQFWNRVVGDLEFAGGDKKIGERGYTKLYYPGVGEPSKAATISVKEGEEVPSIDFLMKQIAVYRIRGKIVNLVSPHQKLGTQLRTMGRGQDLEWDFAGGEASVRADGSFEIAEIVPGEYTVMAFFGDEGKLYSAQEDVDVGDSDVNGLTITIAPGVTLPGRLIWDGNPTLDDESVSVSAQPAQSGFFWGGGARVEADGRFTLKDVPQGAFRVMVMGISNDCYVKEMRQGESVLTDDILRVTRGSAGSLEIAVSSRGARIEGSVTNDDHLPASGVWVVAVPEESKRKLQRLYKSFATDQYGRFTLRGLTPGNYKLFAWDGIQQGEWQDSEFLKMYEEKGTPVEVKDGDSQVSELKLIPLKEITRTD